MTVRTSAGRRDRPNILFILADDMGYGDFGCFSEGRLATPALDQLVATSLCLTQHYSASPVCAPARASLLTGRYPHRTGAIDTLEMRGLDRMSLRERTIAELLRDAGYVTGLVGKWHNGALDPRHHPTSRGFDEFVGFCGGWSPYFEWRIERGTSPATEVLDADGRYLTDVFTEEAVAFLRRHRSEPFFLHLAYNAPHFPYQARPDDLARFEGREELTPAVRAIYAMIERMDAGIARVLEELDVCGLAENTLVLFSSDNGPQLGVYGIWDTRRFNCGFRGAKLLVYEGGIRLPMVVRWPAGLARTGTLDDMVHLTDWLPTLVGLAGGTLPRDRVLDGVDVLPLLQGERGKTCDRRFWQWNRYAPYGECNAAMRDGQWKLVRPAIDELMRVRDDDWAMDVASKPDREGKFTDIVRDPVELPVPAAVAPSQLFDLESDPLEEHDLAAAHPERVRRMEAELAAWFEEVEAERRAIPDLP
jgi:arylsulfatase A-like enzyme